MSTLAIPEARPKAATFGSRGLMSLVFLLLCALLPAARALAQTQVGTLSVTNPTYLAIDTDASGTRWLYVSNHGQVDGSGGGVVYKFNLTTGSTTGIALSSHGSGSGPGQAQFISPDGIAVDPATHDLYVSDRYLNRIVRMHNDGTFVSTWGTASPASSSDFEMHGPSGLAIDGSGALYVAEHGDANADPSHLGQHVSKFTFSGTTPSLAWKKGFFNNFGPRVPYGFWSSGPYGVALIGSNVYVGDAGDEWIQVFSTSDGTAVTQIPTANGAQPLGLSADASGNLWVGETSSNPGNLDGSGALQQVQRYSVSSGTFDLTVPRTSSLSGFAAVFDSAGNKLYVADYSNNQVAIYTIGAPANPVPVVSNASVSGTVGTPISTVTVSATNSPTSFSALQLAAYGLAIDASGNITGTPTATASNATAQVTATNAAGTSTPATITLNIAPSVTVTNPPASGPAVTSFAFVPHQFYFEIHFSEPVTGVAMDSFVFTKEDRAQTHGSFDSITQIDPQTYRLNIGYTHGTETDPAAPGALRFDLKTSGSGIVGSTSGLAYSGAGITAAVVPVTPYLETDAPTVVGFEPLTPTGNTVIFQVRFDKGVFNIQPSNITFNTTGTATATLGYVQPDANDVESSWWDIPVTFGGSGTISVTLTGAPGTISDGAQNYNYYVGPDTSGVFTIPAPSGGGSAPVLNNAVVSGNVGTAITPVQVYASNAPTRFDAPGLATYGLSINASGLITGNPTATANNATVSVTATNATGTSAAATITLFIGSGSPPPPPSGNPPVVTNTSVSGTVNTAIAPVTVSASNSPTSFTSTGLAAYGLSISNTGVISGVPTAPAAGATVQVTATNAYGSGNGNITLNLATAGTVPTVTSATTAAATVGTTFTYQITASGSPTTFAATGLTGTGLSLNATTGVISGAPNAAGSISSQLTATNGTGTSAAVTLTITVNNPVTIPSTPSITSNSTASGRVGEAFSYQITASPAATSYAADSLSGTALAINTTNGVISGTPNTAGTITTHLTATNSGGTSAAFTLTISVAAALPPPPPPVPTITSATTASGKVANAFSYQIMATSSPTLFAADNLAGTGLTLDPFAGVISGTPNTAGTITTHLSASNNGGTSATVTLTITIAPLQDQHLVFVAPTGTEFVGDTFVLAASNSSGLPITYTVVSGPGTITGNSLLFTGSTPVVVRASSAGNTTYAAASVDVTITASQRSQIINPPQFPASVHTDVGSITLDASVNSGLPITYSVVSGPATIDGNKLVFTGTGNITVQATQAGNDTYAPSTSTFTLTANPVPRLVNISSRLRVSAGDANGASIAGFVVSGDKPKQILLRAVGPSLKAFGIGAPLANPTLQLFDHTNTMIGSNNGWNDDVAISAAGDKVGAFTLGAGSKDAALLVTLQPGSYTAQVSSADNSGTVLVEVYDVSATDAVPTKQLINISTRGSVGTGDDVLIGGFSVSGNEPKKVLIRAVGPALGTFGVSGVLSDPIITVYSGTTIVAQNDNWGTEDASLTGSSAADISAAATATGAFPIASGSADAAMILTLQPGQYSAIVTGANGSTGAAMVEVYEIPDSTK